ncbi:multiple sugar transport system substrate-binding protein [Nocardioides terrae]|uniref:Multiple sugar transport system substrate-binding protein n=1 Tax=Nocardioides terrae TaxID=574651 RepID=A0A1I1HY23_9ACTN|nr:extracellular solute-binding protein [Nocardioides terrae]SFC28844.1 multiple sugar transport system substrate-binding protein [Nocardioides terrae]
MTLRTRIARAAVLVAAGSLALAACNSDAEPSANPKPSPTKSTAPPPPPAKLTFGAWGSPAELAAYQRVVDDYNVSTRQAQVTFKSWPDDASMMQQIGAGQSTPDVFLISRGDLQQLWNDKRLEPVDSYLDARAVDIGDEYSRDALEAFSAEHHLQCMPYAVSPRVIYYNTDLVDFARMKAVGLNVPGASNRSWSLEEFQTAATFATSVRPGVRGFAIDPTVSGLAPFITSAGGKLVNDDQTSLAFSDDSTKGALQQILATLSNPQLTLTDRQLQRQSALQWFEQGRVAMIAGDRSLVPQLRGVDDLHWDVIPMPTVDEASTVGDFTGLCLSRTTQRREAAADLLVALSSDQMVRTVTQTGYMVPVNQQVALSEDFRQPLLQPLHAPIFVSTVRNMQILPFTRQWPTLEQAVAAPLRQLLQGGPTADLDALTTQIDELSKPVLAPPASPSATPAG